MTSDTMTDTEKGEPVQLDEREPDNHRRDIDLDDLSDHEPTNDDEEEYPNDLTDSQPPLNTRRSILHPFVHHNTPWRHRLKNFLFPKTSPEDCENITVPNYRYMPILSGIVIPFSILLEIPGLTDRWYIRTEANHIVETRPNPIIIDVGMAFSMFCAVCANLSLIGRFLEWRVGLMTLLCVIFLSVHDVINIVAVTVFGVEHRFDDGFTYGQSFWMTVCSTVASTFTNVTLIVDLVRTKNFQASGSGLTRRQRSLSIIIILLLTYLAIGSLINSFLIDLTFIDALYFSILTIEAIGFGDVVPQTPGARVFVAFYAVGGLVNLALAIGLIRETVLEALEVGYYQRGQDVRRRRKVTNWKRRVIRRWRTAVEWRLTELGRPVWVEDDASSMEQFWLYGLRKMASWAREKIQSMDAYFDLGLFSEDGKIDGEKGSLASYKHPKLKTPRGMKLNLEALSHRQLESAAMEAGVALQLLLPVDFWEHRERAAKEQKTLPTKNPHSRNSSAHFAMPSSPATPMVMPSSPATPNFASGQRVSPHDILQPHDVAKGDVPLTHARMGRMIAMVGKFALAVDNSGHLNGTTPRPKGQSRKRSTEQPTAARETEATSYGIFQESIEEEEKRAFHSRLIVSLTLFLIFWTVGGAIFRATEGWSYGEALYFCVVAFTTIGYGDFSPKTPAGRSIFVAWALLGVGAMTVLISIIVEAYSDRYQNALHSGAFARAVRQYRNSPAESTIPRKRQRPQPPSCLPPGTTSEHTAKALSESEGKAREKLERLPHQMLRNARAFQQHVHFFVGPDAKATGNLGDVPEGLKRLMDEISGEEKLAERIKQEILQDESARQTLFTLGIEKALKRLIDTAEEAIDALTERDHMMVAHQLSQDQSPSS